MENQDAHPAAQPAPEPQPVPPPVPDLPAYHRPKGKHHRGRIIAVLAILAVVVLAGGSAAYVLTRGKKPAPQGHLQTTQAPAVVTPDVQTSGESQQYTSNGKDLNLSFAYASGWTVTPASGDNASDQPITVTSPLITLTDAAGSAVTGRIVVSIRPGGTTVQELSSGNANAGQSSIQIAYNKPTAVQHQYPYISFIHLAGGSNPSGSFEEVMVTGITTFTKSQPIIPESLGQLDPIIAARFYRCSTQSCSPASSVSLSITADTWQNNDACKQALALFESLQIN